MTSDYTPTTEDVREDFALPWSPDQIGDRTARVAAFDRWLSEHDRQVAERAWDQGQKAGLLRADFEYGAIGYQHVRGNPYRKEQENNNA